MARGDCAAGIEGIKDYADYAEKDKSNPLILHISQVEKIPNPFFPSEAKKTGWNFLWYL
jgi:hypothetical protein